MSRLLNVAKIRELRDKRGLSLQEAADAAGLKFRQRWGDLEAGIKTNVKLDTLAGIAKALGVKPSSLIIDPPKE